MTAPTIRDARDEDFAAVAEIASEGGSHADDHYLAFVAAHGALRVVTDDDGTVVAFGGVIPVGDATTMLTDLFVTTACRGRRIGSALLEALFAGAEQRMTFSSRHAAALPAYRRAGMIPGWRLLYLRGSVPNGSTMGRAVRTRPLQRVTGSLDRPELADHFRALGADVRANAILLGETLTGTEDHAETETRPAQAIDIVRLRDPRGIVAFDELLASLPAGASVSCCAPEHSPVASHARANGFVVVDHDVFCATAGVSIPLDLHCLHPGLA